MQRESDANTNGKWLKLFNAKGIRCKYKGSLFAIKTNRPLTWGSCLCQPGPQVIEVLVAQILSFHTPSTVYCQLLSSLFIYKRDNYMLTLGVTQHIKTHNIVSFFLWEIVLQHTFFSSKLCHLLDEIILQHEISSIQAGQQQMGLGFIFQYWLIYDLQPIAGLNFKGTKNSSKALSIL
jgi:hypothetical protein